MTRLKNGWTCTTPIDYEYPTVNKFNDIVKRHSNLHSDEISFAYLLESKEHMTNIIYKHGIHN